VGEENENEVHLPRIDRLRATARQQSLPYVVYRATLARLLAPAIAGRSEGYRMGRASPLADARPLFAMAGRRRRGRRRGRAGMAYARSGKKEKDP
jgi:hypothetical protein